MGDAFDAGAKFPPPVIESGTNRLVDGRHRYEVYRSRGIREIDVVQKKYLNETELFADAVRLNTAHGYSLTSYDIRVAIARLEAEGFKREKISEVVRIPVVKIEEIIKGFAHNVSGEPIALKGGLRHKAGETLSIPQVSALKRYGGHSAVFYIHQIISLLENDLWPKESNTFVEAMNRLTALWLASTQSDATAERNASRASVRRGPPDDRPNAAA